MIRQICSIKPEDVARVRSSELLAKLQLEDLNLILREKASLVWTGGGGEEQTWKKLTGGGRGGGGGANKHERNWQRKTAVSGSSPQLTLKKGAPGDQVWDLLCVQLASYLERGPLMWMIPLHLHVNQKIRLWYDMISLNMCFGCSKNRLIEIVLLVLLSTNNICFGWEIRKLSFNYTLLSRSAEC